MFVSVFSTGIVRAEDNDNNSGRTTKPGIAYPRDGVTSSSPSMGIRTGLGKPPERDESKMSKKDVVDYRYGSAMQKIRNEYTRLNTVITRLSGASFDMTDAKAKLVIANTKIGLAQTAVDALKAYIASVNGANVAPTTTGGTTKISSANATQIRHLAKVAKEAIQTAHKANMAVLHAITASFGLGDDNNDSDDHEGNQNSASASKCAPNSAPSIKVLSPNGGETFTAGQQITVKWKSCNIASTFSPMYVSITDGTSATGQSVQSVNDGTELLTVPNYPQGSNYKVRVNMGASTPIFDMSDNSFSIGINTSQNPN